MGSPQSTSAASFSFASSSLSSALTEPDTHVHVIGSSDQQVANIGAVTGHQLHAQASRLHVPAVQCAESCGSSHSPTHQQHFRSELPSHVRTTDYAQPGHDRQHTTYVGHSSESPYSNGGTDFANMDERAYEPLDDVDMRHVEEVSAATTAESSPARGSSAEHDAHAATALANYLSSRGSTSLSPPPPLPHRVYSHQDPLTHAQGYTQPHSPIPSPLDQHALSHFEISSNNFQQASTSHVNSSPSSPALAHSPQSSQAGDVAAAYLAQMAKRQPARPRIVIETLSDIQASPTLTDSDMWSGSARGRPQNPPKLSSKLPVADE